MATRKKKSSPAAPAAKSAPAPVKAEKSAKAPLKSGLTELKRVSKYNGIELPDVGSSMSVDEAKDFFAQTYPGIINCSVKGPEEDGDKLVYSFVQNTGTRG